MPRIAYTLTEDEIELQAIRAQGAGGQNVNKVSNAVHLRFDVRSSSLPDELKSDYWQGVTSASPTTASSSSRRSPIAASKRIAQTR
jgi:hypothetical protein